MKPRLFLPALAVIAATGGAFYSLQAQDNQPKQERRFQFRSDGNAGQAGLNKDQINEMLDQMGLSGDMRRQVEKALEQAQGGGGNAAPGQPKQFRFELRNDGSGPRFFKDGKEIKPGADKKNNSDDGDEAGDDDNGSQRDQLQKQMEEMMRRHMGGDDSGENNPLDDLLKRLGPNGRGGNGGAQQQAPDFHQLFQGLQQGGGNAFGGATPRHSKFHRSALAEWRPLTRAARESTIRIMHDNKQVAFGTIVSADGYALTKASEMPKDGFECEFHDGRIVSAKVVDKMESYDLALIKLEAQGLTPVIFSPNEAAVGTLVAAVGVDEDPLAVGVISVAARSLSEKGKGALGIRFDPDATKASKGVTVGEVYAGAPAADAGLKAGDSILSVNGNEVEFQAQLQKLVAGMKPGDPVKVRYLRDGKEGELEFSLTSREELARISGMSGMGGRRFLDPTAQMGSVLSNNATGYPNAVQSDLTIDSNDCGSPVVDVDGHVVAINIARSERVSTYMIPGKVVQGLLSNLETGKFTLAKDADTLHSEVREYESAIRKAQQAMKDAEARRAEAEEALKKLRR